MALGALATQSCESTGKHYGYYDSDHSDHDRYYHEGQSDDNKQLPLRPLNCVKQVLRCAGIFRSSRCVGRFSPADTYPSAG